MKYFILIRNNKIINAGFDYELDYIRETYHNIDESKTFTNVHTGGQHEVLYLYTE